MNEAREPATGTLAQEALRLVEVLGVLAGEHASGRERAGTGTSSHVGSHVGSHSGSHSGCTNGDDGCTGADGVGAGWSGVGAAAECRVCPVCRLISGARQLRPEVLAHLVAAGEELLAAAREFAASGAGAGAGGGAGAGAGAGGSGAGGWGVGNGAWSEAGSAPSGLPAEGVAPSRRPERIELD